ncbi:McrB family protein [Haliangium ochraceum]|uniref:GTPase subunit of restriction endonuclease-like protein n=1 Tax=Haliangium ochraceum (strain DSM 14365 / JCM 11303 / SMP-2) TaxID=502025 RepID=D0LTJ0_HALO1|nr:GTPase subunit of restriction endonuclease-like protein [Haliangium ochraceum]ACY13885.1 GTPase subunit of restriction endonuclease-like protein [Haliangium ochraceum DSM 14365]
MSDPQPLSAKRLRELAKHFHESVLPDSYQDRYQRSLDLIERARSWSEDELRTAEAQRELWESDAQGSVGTGKLVDTRDAYDDASLIEELLALRQRTWPEEVEARARAMADAYETLIETISERAGTRKPRAKLLRVMATLIPEHLNRCFDSSSQKRLSKLLGTPYNTRLHAAVRARHRLREVLGAEQSLAEHVERSLFCWWLANQYEALSDGSESASERALHLPETDGEQDAPTPLRLWSFKRQRKGLGAIRGYDDTLLAIVQACEGGGTQDDIAMALREILPDLKSSSVRTLMSTTRALDLIEHRDGLWYPSETGEEALDSDPPDVLVVRILERVYGMAQLLRSAEDGTPREAAELYDALRARYPNWQSDFAPSALLAWANSLGLMARDEVGHWQLTDYGAYWAERLPDTLPEAPSADETSDEANIALATRSSADDGEATIQASARAPWTPPAFADILSEFQRDQALRRFVFDKDDMLALHLAWHPPAQQEQVQPRKRFVVLSGLSGTGKSALLVHYARIYCRLIGIERPDAHYDMVAVSPDWRDPSGLLGYVNALSSDPSYLREPTLVHLLAANANPHQPYFLLLDEMNLAHPEHYFAPFLSAMETGGRLHLHAHDSPLLDVPNSIPWPRNLFIGGTVNMDETTHAFSDKVLDRAFTIEFWNVDLERFFAARRDADVADVANVDQVYDMFLQLNQALFEVRRHVGYRSVGEAIDFVRAAARGAHVGDDAAMWRFVDQAVHAKVLPRLRGHDDDSLRAALDAARDICNARGLERCTTKLDRMRAMLEQTGVTRFFA